MFNKRKLSDQEIEDLKINAFHLDTFATNIFSALKQLKEKRHCFKERNLVMGIL